MCSTPCGITDRITYTREFAPLLAKCVQGRAAGPLLRSRRRFDRPDGCDCITEAGLRGSLDSALGGSAKGGVQTAHDRKLAFRKVLRERWGGASKDRMTAEFKKLVQKVTGGAGWTLYDLRHAATQGMKGAGLPVLELRYLTGHACDDILNGYASVRPEVMRDYFRAVQALIDAVAARAVELGLTAAKATCCSPRSGGLLHETRVAGENPVPKLPRFNRGGPEDPADRRPGDGSAELVAGPLRQVGHGPTARGPVRRGYEFAGHRPNRGPFHRGKKPVCDRDRTDLRVRILRPPTAFATCGR